MQKSTKPPEKSTTRTFALKAYPATGKVNEPIASEHSNFPIEATKDAKVAKFDQFVENVKSEATKKKESEGLSEVECTDWDSSEQSISSWNSDSDSEASEIPDLQSDDSSSQNSSSDSDDDPTIPVICRNQIHNSGGSALDSRSEGWIRLKLAEQKNSRFSINTCFLPKKKLKSIKNLDRLVRNWKNIRFSIIGTI